MFGITQFDGSVERILTEVGKPVFKVQVRLCVRQKLVCVFISGKT